MTGPHWRALWAAQLGYMLDAMDVLLYVFALQTIRAEFDLTNAEAGLVGSVTQLSSAAGGFLFGWLADRIGRKRSLMYTILVYSLASGGTATAGSLAGLLFWRAAVGVGLGGEWSTGALLVAETWPADKRGKAIGIMQSGWALGYMLAAGVTALVLPRFGWRTLFLVGVLPALLTAWVRKYVAEPEVWKRTPERPSVVGLFRGHLLRRTLLATALSTSVMFAYWGLFSWLPPFLSAPRSQGGAGLDVMQTSGWVFVVQSGALAGYLLFGWSADRFGRRRTFAVYVLAAALLTPIYGYVPAWGGAGALLVLGPFIGFFGTGYFSLFGAMLAELYPTALRGAGQGLTYNLGRSLSAVAPFLTGFVADRSGFGAALAINAVFFVAGALLVYTLPETRSVELETVH